MIEETDRIKPVVDVAVLVGESFGDGSRGMGRGCPGGSPRDAVI